MPVTYASSQVQQNFGRVMDRAMIEDDVIVERYGAPRVVIVAYERYQELLEAERTLLRTRLQQASAQVAERTRALGDADLAALIETVREEVTGESGQ